MGAQHRPPTRRVPADQRKDRTMDDYGNSLAMHYASMSIQAFEAGCRFLADGVEDYFSTGYLISIGAI
jgi:hypothetical protein